MDKTFEKARTFIYQNARPVDLTRWRYHFENGSREDVLTALAAYQNADGGFGHALEADSWNPDSSPIQTWAATEILREIGWTDADHPIVQGILRYLASGDAFDGRHWLFAVPSNNDHPGAPWWTYRADDVSDDNPTASLAGFLVRFASRGSAPHDLGCSLARRAYETFRSLGDIANMHTLANYEQMLQYIDAAGEQTLVDRDAYKNALRAQVRNVITRDTEQWKTGYVCRPSRFIASRDSAYFDDNRELALYECVFLRETQLADGSWNVPWGWQGYEEQWSISKNWWKSSIVIENILYLKHMEA